MTNDDPRMSERFPDRMNASGAVLWDIEQDPVLRSTITAVAVLDRAPTWGALRQRIDYASRVIPRLRQRVVVPPLRLGQPRWVVDGDFDLDYHLRRAHLPAPGTMRELLDLVQPLAIAPFDRSRPLWEFTVVDGLEGGRAALVQKIHHALTDGVGAIEMAMAILDTRRRTRAPDMPPEPAAGPASGPGGNLAGAWDELAALPGASLRFGLDLSAGLARAAMGTAMRPVSSARNAQHLASSIAKMVAPVPRSASPILTGRGLRRRFETIDLPLAELKAAGHSAGCSANDAFLAAVVEGLRRYHLRHDVEVDELRLTMPISLRVDGDESGGNHFAPARFTVPTDIDDPAERMQRLGAIARSWRSEPALPHSDTIATVLDRLPRVVTTEVFGAMLKHIDAVVTNVPGVPMRSYLAGAEVLRQYAFAPPTGAAINVALVSNVDTACIGVVTDSAALPDDDVWLECLVEGFNDVLAINSQHAHRTG